MRRRKILLENEEQWNLKSHAIWLSVGDEKIILFQNYAKGRKNTNTIWEPEKSQGGVIKYFNELSTLGKHNFKSLFAVQKGGTIGEVIIVEQLFPRYANEGEN